ncbi:hypothetical protein I2486_21560 [Cellulophaga sp. E16_2]|uniref:hypothetical protein n=1 Tax=unclassified Cellulophaga TaxID=2634405 RepID=UPI001A92C188|nr:MULTISPECIES: hypothetical protein [unclassified Cellulophaga]MBO0593996.1 hypothetical protein [Cellulophaga sp. E16_2]MCL5247801.1 hypothetical protein [Cellulophaga sp. 20_2_10]
MKIKIISIISFFILTNLFGQTDIKSNWINKNISKLSIIYYPGNLDCKNCEENITEIKENGIFTHKYESVFGGFEIIQGTLNKSNLEYLKNITLKASVHKYPKNKFSNGEKIIRKDLAQFYFLIHTNNEIRKSIFLGTPPNGDKLIEFLLNIAEFNDWKKINDYKFEIE